MTIEYIRPAQDNFEERTCGTVIYGTVNMAEALLNKGLAAVLRSRKDASDDRSRVYDDLLLAEEK